jgi:hypothetical protein
MRKALAAIFVAAALIALAQPALAEEKQKDDSKGDKFDQGKKGDALGGLERTAGKKAGDVNVPPPSPPAPVEPPKKP